MRKKTFFFSSYINKTERIEVNYTCIFQCLDIIELTYNYLFILNAFFSTNITLYVCLRVGRIISKNHRYIMCTLLWLNMHFACARSHAHNKRKILSSKNAIVWCLAFKMEFFKWFAFYG